jgi:hypothetical protein
MGVLCFSHDHVFVVDVLTGEVTAQRFQDGQFHRVTFDADTAIPSRSEAGLHDIQPIGDGSSQTS